MSLALSQFLWIAALVPEESRASDKQRRQDTLDIVVTGERVPRSLRDTPSSVSVVTANQLEGGAALDRIEQVLALIPNVQLGSQGEGPTIRGQDATGAMRDLPAFLGGTRPRTTLVVDGRAVSYNEFVFGIAPLWDIDRIEVFRTPQTTTQGRNSIAGAIFVRSRDPSAQWEVRGRALAGNFQTRHLSASLSGPIFSDDVGFRLSGDWRKRRPSSEIADRMRGADPDRDEYGLLRAKLVARPSALPGSRVELIYSHSQSQMPQIEGVRAPFKLRRDPLDGYGVFRTSVHSLTALAEYRASDNLSGRGIVSLGDAKIRRFAPPGLGETKIATNDWSAETFVTWVTQSDFQVTGGASFVRVKLDQVIDLSVLSGVGAFDDNQSGLGLFGEASWRPVPRAQVTVGLRYQRDRQDRAGFMEGPSGRLPLVYLRGFAAWLPRISVSYDIGRGVVGGVLVQRAYNPGGATLRFDTGRLDEFDAEFLWNYEVFARAAFGGVNAQVNLFRADIRGAQRSRPIVILAPTGIPVTFADLFNVDAARSQGLEAEAEWRITARFSARGALGLINTKITRASGPAASLQGLEFQRAPRLTGAMSFDWRPIDTLRLSAQLKHNGGYFSDDANTPSRRVGQSTIVDARASWSAGRVTLFGYARNILDAFQMTYLFSPTFGTAGNPREIGAGIQAAF